VVAVAGIKRFCLKMFSSSGFDFLAGHPFVDVRSPRLRRFFVFFGALVFFCALLHHARHALAEKDELLL